MDTVIIQYNAGNVRSVDFALQRLGITPVITDDADTINAAARVIFPGVGHAATAMQYLRQKNLHLLLPRLRQPVLGICLGMQLMCRFSEEGQTTGLGIFDTGVKKFERHGLKVPHTGWNTLAETSGKLFEGLPANPWMYFVHGYYALPCAHTAASTDYGLTFSSALCTNNFYGVQFHPEKSGETGQRLLSNFIQL